MTAKLSEWVVLQAQLKQIKQKEAELRRELCADIIGIPHYENGRYTVKRFIDGYDVKAVQTLNYSVDKATIMALWDILDTQAKACIDWKPSLVMREYKTLGEDSVLHDAISTKPAMPTLEAKEPVNGT